MLSSSEDISENKRESLQAIVEKSETIDELVKLFTYIDMSETKAFLTNQIEELPLSNVNFAYFGVQSIEEILCKELLMHIFSFLYILERFKYATLSQTFYQIVYLSPPSAIDITHLETWISFDINIQTICISDMLFLYEKRYPTYIKLNPLRSSTGINYLLNKLNLNISNLKIGAQGISLINKIATKYQKAKEEKNEKIPKKLSEWLSNLESLAFSANDVGKINSFLLQYEPNLLYLSIDSIRYNVGNAHPQNLYFSDEQQEGYDAPQPTPTPKLSINQQHGSSSCYSSPQPTNTANSTLSSDYSASDDDDYSFFAIHESSDGYHHEGHYGKYHQLMHHNSNGHKSSKSHINHRVFRNSHASSFTNHRQHHHHHRYRNKQRTKSNQLIGRGDHSRNHRGSIPISFRYRSPTMISEMGNNDSDDVINYEKVQALQIFSSYSEIKISSIGHLMKTCVKYLGIDINVTKQNEIENLQNLIFDKDASPYLNHLSVTDFKSFILIPNRIHSLVIQRWFTNLSNLQFESQFFPYDLCCNTSDIESCYLSTTLLNTRLHSLTSTKGDDLLGIGCMDTLSSSDCNNDEDESGTEMIRKQKKREKPIYLNQIVGNLSSQLFEIKLLLNFDIVRNRWIILKEQYEFLLRLKCIEALRVIHLVMVHQSVLDKHCNQYYSRGKKKECKGSNSLSPSNSIVNIHNLHSIQNGNGNGNGSNNKKIAIYEFPVFGCQWHQKNGLSVIAPLECIKNKIFKEAFPFATFYSYNPMIRNVYYDDEQWLLRKKLMQISDLFSVGLPNQLQYPS